MHKILKYMAYLSIILFYSVTAIYTGVVHNHEFTWNENEDCPAHVISTTQNSDTFPFSINHNFNPSEVNIFNFQTLELYFNFEIKNSVLSRAPPSFI